MGDHSIERTFICFFARAFAEIDLTSPAVKNPRIVLGILPFAAGRRRDVLGMGGETTRVRLVNGMELDGHQCSDIE